MNREALDAAGLQFELAVCQQLNVQLRDTSIIHDKALFSHKLNCPTQIDVLAITNKCIYVIECKNWKNAVRGNLNSRIWTGVAANRHNMTVINIYDQNMIHARALQAAYYKEHKKFLPLEPMIIVPDSTKVESDCDCIYHFSQIAKVIQLKEQDKVVVQDVKEITAQLRKVLKKYDEVSNLR